MIEPPTLTDLPDATALAVTTQGLADVIARRVEQVARFGHTPQADAAMSLHWFARELSSMAVRVREDSHFAVDLAIMRRHVVTLAAFAIAMVDRIDAHPPEDKF